MAWMITYDRLDYDQREFLGLISSNDENYIYTGEDRYNLCVIAVHTIRHLWERSVNSITIILPNILVKSYFIAGLNEIGISLKTVHVITEFEHVNTLQGSQVIIVNCKENFINNIDKNRNRLIVFSRDKNPIEGFNNYNNSYIHHIKHSISRLSNLIKGRTEYFQRKELSRIDTAIRTVNADLVLQEYDYLLSEINKCRAIGDSTIVLFPNFHFLIRFIQYVYDYTFFDLAELADDISLEKLNETLAYYGSQFYIIDKDSSLPKNAHNLIILSTYDTGLFLIKNYDHVFIPNLNRVINGTPRSTQLAELVKLTNMNLYLTSSKDNSVPGSIANFLLTQEHYKELNIIEVCLG